MGIEFVRRFIHPSQAKTGSLWSRRQTSTRYTSKPDPTNLHQVEGWWAAVTGVETCPWPTVDHLDPPDLPQHGCNSDRGPAASRGPTVLANNRNGWSLQLNASRHDDDDYGIEFAHRDKSFILLLIVSFAAAANTWKLNWPFFLCVGPDDEASSLQFSCLLPVYHVTV